MVKEKVENSSHFTNSHNKEWFEKTSSFFNVAFFDYDLVLKRAWYSEVAKSMANTTSAETEIEDYGARGMIHPDDLQRYIEFFSEVMSNNNNNNVGYFRVKYGDNEYHWKKYIVSSLEKDGLCTNIFGIIEDAMGNREFQNIIDQSIVADYDFVAVIDVEKRTYTVHGERFDTNVLKGNGFYDEDIQYYAENFLKSTEQSRYLSSMRLEKVLWELSRSDVYEYTYNIADKDNKIATKRVRFAYCSNSALILLTRRDVTVDIQKEELIYAGMHDTFTGLYNKEVFTSRCSFAIEENKDHTNYLVILDINRLKYINDTFGHLVGDEVIMFVATKLKKYFEADIIGRFGGDEFEIFVANTSKQKLIGRLNIFSKSLSGIKRINSKISDLGCAYGYTKIEKNDTFAEAFHRADMAMYSYKKGKK